MIDQSECLMKNLFHFSFKLSRLMHTICLLFNLNYDWESLFPLKNLTSFDQFVLFFFPNHFLHHFIRPHYIMNRFDLYFFFRVLDFRPKPGKLQDCYLFTDENSIPFKLIIIYYLENYLKVNPQLLIMFVEVVLIQSWATIALHFEMITLLDGQKKYQISLKYYLTIILIILWSLKLLLFYYKDY